MHRANTYHVKPESTLLNHLNGHYHNAPHEVTKKQDAAETHKEVAYGHTVADVEQQILDWLKELAESGK